MFIFVIFYQHPDDIHHFRQGMTFIIADYIRDFIQQFNQLFVLFLTGWDKDKFCLG